ncbi:hypothetical protein I5677_04855 [Mobilitalea sibirica]|uniref:LPXTG-motif cell wall-anchored protein n=1 Tax=Mobilitalea sibirica TaxID=1462919 RepID=A0A8J7KVJ0_9FIRM|nr:hypothetical protein [Mobilitalea sibirica]MBH1940225.1 hypothetical protein [Mobilitalea sibirica]
MKHLKRIMTIIVALTIVALMIPISAMAATDTVDFEDGNYDAFFLRMDSDSDNSILSVVELNGSKALKVDVQDANKTPKIQIQVSDLVNSKKLDQIETIELDLVIENPENSPVGENYGGIGNFGEGHYPNWSQGEDWSIIDSEKSISSVTKLSRTFSKASEKFRNNVKSSYVLMKWMGNTNDMYIDNVRFLDKDGNPIELKVAEAEAMANTADDSIDNANDNTADDSTDNANDNTAEELPETGNNILIIIFIAVAAVIILFCVIIFMKKSRLNKSNS